MSRSARLLSLIQTLRQHRFPVSGATLAAEFNISVRTLYRDIQTLQAQGAHIEGEPGIGYVLRPGFMLPPLMFSEDELEALVLGSRWVADRADARLSGAARAALAKISAVLPADLRHDLDTNALIIGPGNAIEAGPIDLAHIRQAIRQERKVQLTYRDLKNAVSTRTIWPIALAFFDQVRVLVAWCETRNTFRHFRADRILAFTALTEPMPRRRAALLKAWRQQEGITPP